MLLLVPTTSSSKNKDKSTQTAETLNFRAAQRQLQVVTQAEAQFKWELHCKQEKLAEEQEDQQARI